MLGEVWAQSTWATRSSQWNKFARFCEEEDRSPCPADEGAVLAYIGYLRLEGRVSAASARQYVSAISRFHVLAGLPSPTASPLVTALLKAYDRATVPDVPSAVRVALPASVMRQVVRLGLQATAVSLVRDAAICTAAYLSGARASSISAMRLSDYGNDGAELTMRLVHRKGRNARDPLVLVFPRHPAVPEEESPQALIARWVGMRPARDGLWVLSEEKDGMTGTVQSALRTVLAALRIEPPHGCAYSSHSLRIGTYNELRVLGFPSQRILHHLGWTTESMQATYYDPRISATADSEWWFGHLRGT